MIVNLFDEMKAGPSGEDKHPFSWNFGNLKLVERVPCELEPRTGVRDQVFPSKRCPSSKLPFAV